FVGVCAVADCSRASLFVAGRKLVTKHSNPPSTFTLFDHLVGTRERRCNVSMGASPSDRHACDTGGMRCPPIALQWVRRGEICVRAAALNPSAPRYADQPVHP